LGFVYFLAENLHFAPFRFSILLPKRDFFNPNYALLAPKTPLFNGYFALFWHVFNGSERFYLYRCYVFLCFSPCVLQHLALRFAAKHLAFSTKTHFI